VHKVFSRSVSVEEISEISDDWDEFWQSGLAGYDFLIARDRAGIEWRYLRHQRRPQRGGQEAEIGRMTQPCTRGYAAVDLAVLVPTKDRPGKVRKLLDSIAAQSARPGRIVFIDGGESIRELVQGYEDQVAVEHHVCQPPGQIRQRNMGIRLLDERTPLVALLDDDIVLEPAAIESMIAFWNRCEPATAGVGFNITNTPPEPRTWVRDLFFLSASVPGRVLKSGATTSNCQVKRDIRVEWLCGGATSWRLDLLRRFSHKPVATPWAIAEDVVFSYPIGKQHPLYVCAAAQVRHEHESDYRVAHPHRFHGWTQALFVMHFVEANEDLSRAAFLWMIVGTVLGRIVVGAATLERRHLEFALGQALAVSQGLWALAHGRSLTTVIEGSREPVG